MLACSFVTAGIDAGGVKREFFQLLFQQLFSLEFAMFQEENDFRVINPTSLLNHDLLGAASASSSSSSSASAADSLSSEARMTLSEYELVGLCLGLALYNNVHLELNFPLQYYRRLLHESHSEEPNRQPLTYTLNELAEIHPQTAKVGASGTQHDSQVAV